jgi:hypothetical protein
MYSQDIAPVRADVFRAANQFCVTRGLVMVPVNVDERPYQLGGHTASVKLTFRAITAAEAKKMAPALGVAKAGTPPALGGAQPLDVYAELTKLDDLKKKGIITEAEFDSEKKKLLASPR